MIVIFKIFISKNNNNNNKNNNKYKKKNKKVEFKEKHEGKRASEATTNFVTTDGVYADTDVERDESEVEVATGNQQQKQSRKK
jgi:hypothetical protein